MAFLHLLNCLLLTYAPVFVIFNSTSLHEHGVRVCMGGLLGYTMSSILKMFAYASFIPISEEWNLLSEVLKESITIVDIIMLVQVYTWKTTRTVDKRSRILGVGLGWGAGELFFSNFLVLIFNASGGEFTWEYLQRSIASNCCLFQIIALAGLIFVRSNSGGLSKLLATLFILAQCFVRPLALSYLINTGMVTVWISIGLQIAWSAVVVFIGKLIVEINS